MTLNSGAFFRLNSTTNIFTITSDAELLIDNGTFQCGAGAVQVGGANSALEVVNGSFVFDPPTSFGFGLYSGGTAIVRAGGVIESATFFNSNNVNTTVGGTFLIDGGTLLASGPQADPLRALYGLGGGGYDFTGIGGSIQIANFTGGDLTAYLQGLATAGFFKIDGVTMSGFSTTDAVKFRYIALTDNGTSGSLVLTEVPAIVWGGAGNAGSPELWDSASNSDPTHWNRATPPNMAGVDKAIINGGGIQKEAPHTFSIGSSMTLNSGAFLRLNSGETDTFYINSGASVVINDGNFEAKTSAVTVSGATSRLKVVSGSFVFDPLTIYGLGLNKGARAIVRAGAVIESTTFFNSQNDGLALVGGTFVIDGGALRASGPQDNPVRASNGLDGGGYDFTGAGGKIQIDDFTGGDLTTYFEGLATTGFFKIGGVTVSGFGPSNEVSGQYLALTDNGTSGSVVLTASSGGFSSWIGGFDVGGQNGLDDNPDHGRLPNGLEFLLGGNPTMANDTALPVVNTEISDLVLTFDRDDQSIGFLDVVVEVSTDLVTWPEEDRILIGADTVSSGAGVTITDEGGTDAVEVRIPRGLDSRKYARIRVSLPNP